MCWSRRSLGRATWKNEVVMTARHDPPTDPGRADARAIEFSVNGLSKRLPAYSAHKRFSLGQRIGIGAAIVGVVGAFAFQPVVAGTVAMSLLTILYVGMLGLRIELAIRGRGDQRVKFTDEELALLDRDLLPTFSILVPAYKEPRVLPNLVANLTALDYPPDRLEIKLLLEEDDTETIAAAAALRLSAPFEVVIVPHIGPRTKPKALNYALLGCTGEFVCIYDAEDCPEPKQLLKVAATFAQLGERVGCVQAELGYYNANENLITRWFAVEYRMWFTQFLPALSRSNAAIPLGGTSNHMRRDLLIRLGAWDPYNVTEDADLGIRLRRCGYTVAVLDSVTHEEANTDFVNWVKQRSRWYKGYLQTWLVHMRHPRQLIKDLGFASFVRFNLFVGGTPILAMLNPVSWALIVMWFVLQPHFIIEIMPAPVYYSGLLGWLFGNFVFYYLNLMAAYEFDDEKVFTAALRLPLYWVMMAIAAFKALLQLVFKPAYWEKTQHGLSSFTHEPTAGLTTAEHEFA
jgi:cellulose synthase/poly-beta-1,6-N-acetylglucosamine synthase-like glycosyltransferase